jgi:hypothetical protein
MPGYLRSIMKTFKKFIMAKHLLLNVLIFYEKNWMHAHQSTQEKSSKTKIHNQKHVAKHSFNIGDTVFIANNFNTTKPNPPN